MGSSPTLATISECSADWSACLIWIQEVVGSNPTTPTTNKVLVRDVAEGSSPSWGTKFLTGVRSQSTVRDKMIK